MRSKSAISGEELLAVLASEVHNWATSSKRSSTEQPSGLRSPDTAAVHEFILAADHDATAVGRMPPQSLSIRGRIGAVLVRIVRRMLFWYTPQIVGFNTAMIRVVQEQAKLLDQILVNTSKAAAEIETLKSQIAAREPELHAEIGDIRAELARQDQQILWQADATRRTEEDIAKAGELFANVEKQVARIETALGDLRSWAMPALEAETRLIAGETRTLQVRTMLFAQERRTAVLLSELRKRLPDVPNGELPKHQELDRLAEEQNDDLDNMYLMLEDEFRGTRDDIKARFAVYVPRLEAAGIGKTNNPVLDVGCGRGEWLELLREHGIAASGVDMNRTFISANEKLGLTVVLEDAIVHLRGRADRSLGAITGFHILEHLPWVQLVELVDETVRVLQPGGLAIFETPNPSNLLVGSRNFYFDPTHRNPLPSQLLQFVLEARGLCNVEVLALHPCPPAMHLPDDGLAVTARFNEYFYSSQDYAVIGRKV